MPKPRPSTTLALVLTRLGEHRQAESHLRQALALHRASGQLRQEAGTLGNLGLANFELDRHALALGQLSNARDLYRTLGDRAGEGDTLNNLGLVHLEAGQLEPAREVLEQALDVQRTLGNSRAEAAVLNNLGRLHRRRRQFESARSHLTRALGLQRQIGDLWGAGSTLHEFALLAADRQALKLALARILEARQIIESLRADLLSPDYRASLIGERREIYELHVDLLMRLHREHPNAGHGAAALVAAEAARARGLIDNLGEIQGSIRHGIDPELLAAQRRLRRRASARESRRQLLKQRGDAQAADFDDEIEDLLAKYQHLEGQIRASNPRYADLIRPEPLTAEDMRGLLDDDTAILEYSLGDERSALWTITSAAITSHVLAPRERIETAARRLHERLSQSHQTIFQGPTRLAAFELAELILEPARETLTHRRIVVVADGALGIIPFAVLPSDRVSGRALGLDHEVLSVPSLSVLASLRRPGGSSGSPEASARKTLAILADPVFDLADPRLEAARRVGVDGRARSSVGATEPPPSLPAAALPAESSPTAEALPRLVHSRHEAQAVAAMVPAEERLLALDFAARRELFTSGALEPFRIVHVATHGLLDAERPELSALVLSQLDTQGRRRDGHLRLLDVYNLRLRADLVVLSACRTALGREIHGEGLISLARGFMYAGARQVLVSLWQVDDQATAALMEHFLPRASWSRNCPPPWLCRPPRHRYPPSPGGARPTIGRDSCFKAIGNSSLALCSGLTLRAEGADGTNRPFGPMNRRGDLPVCC